MMKMMIWWLPLLLACLSYTSQYSSSVGGVLNLERIFPMANHDHNRIYDVEARDRARHARMTGIIDFPLIGSFDPLLGGMYYSKIKLGTPPKEYNMVIDTGSEISWVSCSSCKNCPRTSWLGVEMNFYDTNSSSTATVVPCDEPICADGCNKTNQCSYSVKYADNSTTSGFYMLDMLYLDTVLRTSQITESTTPIVFGANYYVYLEGIGIHGNILAIDPVNFETSANQGTVFDSGTTFVYIVTEAYESIVKVITTIVSPSAKPIMSGTHDPCYLISSSLSNNIADVFPTISLNFAGGAFMNLRPADYLKQMGYFEGAAKWCIYYVRSNPGLTIIGEAALKDRVVVYDLARQRIGWADYNCSLPLNVSISSGIDKVVHPGAFDHLIKLILISYLFWI